MSYSMKDVDNAESLIRQLRPDIMISRGDYDWALSICDKDRTCAFIVFRPEMDGRDEISSTLDQIRDLCFFFGSQWTAEEALRLGVAARKSFDKRPINRISQAGD